MLSETALRAGVHDQHQCDALADRRYATLVDRLTAAPADEVLSTPTHVFEGELRMAGAQDYAVFASGTSRVLGRR